MENKPPKNVFDQLEDITKQNQYTQQQNQFTQAQNAEIIKLLKEIKEQGARDEEYEEDDEPRTDLSDKELLNAMIKESKKQYMFFGRKEDLEKRKHLIITLCIILVVVGIMATIFTTLAFKLYSTLSLFENIWMILAIVMTVNMTKLSPVISDIEMKDISYLAYIMDKDRTWVNSYEELKRYKVFRIISYISVLGNLIVVWVNGASGFAAAATIFELAFAGATALMLVGRSRLQFKYGNIVVFDCTNPYTNERFKLVGDYMDRKLYTYEDYMSKFGKIFNE